MSLPVLPSIGPDRIMIGAQRAFDIENSLGGLLLERLREHGSSILLVDSQTGKTVTALGLVNAIAAVAENLQTRGIHVGDTIGFCSENRIEFPVPVIATIAVGATCAPLNPLYTHDELIHTIGISQPSIVFCSPLTASKLVAVQSKLPFIKTLIVFGDVETNGTFVAYNDLLKVPADPALINFAKVDVATNVGVALCSSGTTGLPKCVELTHANVLSFLISLMDKRLFGETFRGTVLGLIPFFHGFGFAMMLAYLIRNVKIVVMPKFDDRMFLKNMQDYKVTLLFAVPPLLVFLAKHPLVDNYDLSSVRRISCGAAPLSPDIQLAVQRRLNIHSIKQGYGMTELSVACVFVPDDRNKVGSSGVVAPGMECKIIDFETGEPLPSKKEGELCFRGPSVMKGYKNNPKATAETIDPDGWLHTGDVAYYDHEGFIFIVDRLKELIKFKGFQVAPAELEALLLTNPAVKDAAVIGIPDEEAGELPFAFIVKRSESTVTAKDIQLFVSRKVSAQKRLSGGVCFVDIIPKNPTGKILRRELRTLFKQNLV